MKVGDLVRITDQPDSYGKLGVIVDVRQATAFNGFVRDAYDVLIGDKVERALWEDELEVISAG